jgi:hypothetical protein
MTRRTVRFALQSLVLVMLVSTAAFCQVSSNDQEAVKILPCQENLNADYGAIAAALGICQEVSQVVNQLASIGPQFSASDISANQALVQNARLVLSKISLASLSAVSDSAALDAETMRAERQPLTPAGKLGIASGIIGLIGGGAGGTLHLVNNPQVGHAATVVGISAGVVGGNIGVVSAYLYGRKPPPPQTPASERITPSLLLRRFAFVKEGHEIDDDLLYRNPERFADLLSQMSKSLSALQTETLPPPVVKQLF